MHCRIGPKICHRQTKIQLVITYIYYYYSKQSINTWFFRYLLFQTLSDLLFLVIIIVQLILEIYIPSKTIFDLSKVTCYYAEYIFVTSNIFSVLLTLILSIDRLYAIQKPLHSTMSLTNRYPVQISISLFAILLIVLHPKFFLKSYNYYKE